MKRVRLSNRVRRAFQGSSRGFSLIEVSIAIALIGVIAVAILGALSYASTVLIITDRQATAESLAKSQMEYVKNQDYDPADPGGVGTYEPITEIPSISIPYGYTICSVNRDDEIVADVVGIPWSSGNSTYEDTGLQKITLVVSYEIVRPENKIVANNFTLEGYKRQSGVLTGV
jgi:prepilin-type N-terminal cleavage/methylation domain-containing protein